ncbi:hypothetical protein EC912_102310 [Luteibacter rhizovicinus]|uniref:DUF4124 domain-containing protein n=1 Tax=Luteibacter rhizovicinus TaxID=242606 RepID=A0A4R3YU48_9GAMM|nr:DUF4124 domain-containing protein [Luteibacter rhizovicinus]TCV95962.1 hypothetical protein EC912_102310 [Luteibacter rhizovicinus]
MTTLLRATFVIVLLCAPAIALAQNPIRRCIGTNGQPVFTDQPCSAMNATAAVPAPTGTPAGNSSSAQPPLPMLCAKHVADLRQVIVDAFATREANRIGGVVLWDGYGSKSAVADIQVIGAMLRQPLVSVGGAGEDADSASEIAVTTSDAGGSRTSRFGIVRQAGCLWLRPPD